MHALGGPDHAPGMGTQARRHPVEPRPGGVDHQPGANLRLPALQDVPHAQAANPVPLLEGPRRLDVVQSHGPVAAGVHDVFHRQALRGIHLSVEVGGGALQPVGPQLGFGPAHLGRVQKTMLGQGLVEAEQVVERHAGAQLGAIERAALVEGQQERQRPDQVRGDAQQGLALAQIHAHQAEIEHFQVAQAAVNQAGRTGRGAGGEIGLLQQDDAQAAASGVARDAGADDAAADDGQIEAGGESGQPSHV
jgi:hypothetical protein